MPTPSLQTPQSAVGNKKDVLGIISIICVFLGMGLVGFILGLVGVSRAKKEHRSAKLSRIGWIVNLVLMLIVIPIAVLLVVNNFKASEVKARDLERAEDLSAIEAGLEDYFNSNFGYPSNLDDVHVSKEQALVAPNGSTIKVNNVVADEEVAMATIDPSGKTQYTYTPYGKPTCTITCDGYVLKALTEKPSKAVPNPLSKLGLNNL
jgi:YD repeat-containing protein